MRLTNSQLFLHFLLFLLITVKEHSEQVFKTCESVPIISF